MTVPNKFTAGQKAASSEVNQNFDSIDSIIGPSSTKFRLKFPADFTMGPRLNTSFSAEMDTVTSQGKKYAQLGWNVDPYKDGTVWKNRRFNEEGASLIRIGEGGFAVYGTLKTTGDLDNQLVHLFGASSHGTDGFVTIGGPISNKTTYPSNSNEMRMTLTMFATPIALYEQISIGKGTITWNVVSLGVPSNAIAVLLMFEGTAGGTDARVLLTQSREDRSQSRGYWVTADANKKGAGQGIVKLGTSGAYKDRFVEDRENQWTKASLYIQGYYM